MNLKTVSIDTVRPYWRNPRKIDKAVEAVKHSIQKYGYNVPIVVDKNNVIIAGHTRYKALRELGFEEIEVIVKNLSEEKAKEFRIADNKTAEKSKWDEDLLLYELRELDDLDDMKIYFDKGELDDLLEIQSMDFDEEDDDPFNEDEQRKIAVAKVETQIREEIGEEYEQRFNNEKEELEKQVETRVQDEMKDKIREEMRKENEKIKQLELERKNKFAQASEEKGDDLIEIQCPHCDEKYALSRGELLRADKVRRTL